MPASELVSTDGPLTENSVAVGGASGRAERVMDRAVTQGVLSESGKTWLEVALDPFHDTDIFVRGLPDYAACDTIVQNVRGKIDIKAPPGLGVGEAYDCHIFFSPRDTTILKAGFYTADGNVITANESASVVANPFGEWGMITVCCVRTGELTLPGPLGSPDYSTGSVSSVQGMSPADQTANADVRTSNYVNGKHRIIAGGVEVINVTEPLYRSGSVTGYRVPGLGVETVVSCYSETTTDYLSVQQEGLLYQLNPGTGSDALNLPSSRMWAAEKGAYYPFRFEGEGQPFREPRQIRLIGNSGQAQAINNIGGGFGAVCLSENMYNLSGASPAPTQIAQREMGMPYKTTQTGLSLGGIYFTGLSSQTKLVVNARWCIERCPDATEYDLKVLAHVSPPFDEHAWKLYTAAISRMPPFVPLDENPLGEWFSDVVSNVLPILGSAAQGFLTGGPGGALVGGLNGAARQAQNHKKKPSTANAQPKRGKGKKKKGARRS